VIRSSRGPETRRTEGLAQSLAFCMILVLMTVRLGNFSEEMFVTPVANAIFDVVFISADDLGSPAKGQTLKLKFSVDCALRQCEVILQKPVLAPAVPSAFVPLFAPNEVAFEIFIPPEV
jgi:hypothetical protein